VKILPEINSVLNRVDKNQEELLQSQKSPTTPIAVEFAEKIPSSKENTEIKIKSLVEQLPPDILEDPTTISSITQEDQSKTSKIPSLETLLRKILRSRKMSSEIDQELEPASATSLADLEQEFKQFKSKMNKKSCKDAATSPPTKRLIEYQQDRERNQLKKKEYRFHSAYNCSCPLQSTVSWVCPGCVSDATTSNDQSVLKTNAVYKSKLKKNILPENTNSTLVKDKFKKSNLIPPKLQQSELKHRDQSILFANDNSMLQSLCDIVSFLDETRIIASNTAQKPIKTTKFEMPEDVNDLISSLNGI
jgi:hypothetical protein